MLFCMLPLWVDCACFLLDVDIYYYTAIDYLCNVSLGWRKQE